MRRNAIVLAYNASRGLDAASKANMLPTFEGRERLYGTHCVESVLNVMARNPSSPLSPDGHRIHPSRRGGGRPHLFVWNRKEGDRGHSHEDDAVGSPPKEKESSAARVEALGRGMNIPVTAVPRSTLVQLCGDRRHQNVVLEVGCYDPRKVAQFPPSLLRVSAATTSSLVLFIDHIIDPMNLGNILRTSYFFGVRDIILSNDCCRCTPTVARASVGVLETLNVLQLAHGVGSATFLGDARRIAGEAGACLELLAATAAPTESAATSAENSRVHNKNRTRVLVLGNEDAGLSSQVLDQCTHGIHIPVLGDHATVRGLSLNVNSACAVLLAHLSSGNPHTTKLNKK